MIKLYNKINCGLALDGITIFVAGCRSDTTPIYLKFYWGNMNYLAISLDKYFA